MSISGNLRSPAQRRPSHSYVRVLLNRAVTTNLLPTSKVEFMLFRYMRVLYHSIANRVAAFLMKIIFRSVGRIYVLHGERANQAGGILLASNHISHFDPFILSSVVRRKIDWMAMAEFFPYPVLGQFLRAVDAFPADRYRANRTTIRTAIERLHDGRMVGIFPEGGIRDGNNSILQGAPARSGVAALSDMARVAVLPCVILGSDRLYNKKRWLPLRRTPIWIAFGKPISANAATSKIAAREWIEGEFVTALNSLFSELRDTFSLTVDDLPQPPQKRMRDLQ